MSTAQTAISSSEDVLDSRDIIARIEYLKDEHGIGNESDCPDSEEHEELASLMELQEKLEGYCPDWEHGVMLIRDSYMVDYAQELAEDIGAISRDMQWPTMYIDWDAATEALKQDYTSAEYDEVTYWAR